MLLRYHAEELKNIIDKIRVLSGMSISIVDPDLRPLVVCSAPFASFCRYIQSTKEGACRCVASDKELFRLCAVSRGYVTHKCHAGLTDTAVPMYHEGVLMGYMLFGQVCETHEERPPFEEIYPKIADLGLNRQKMEIAYHELNAFDKNRIESAVEIVNMLTQYILLKHIIRLQHSEEFEALLLYIEEHLTEELSISELCRRFHISKNTLYRYFRTDFNCTVGEYITKLRLQKAELLLTTTELPIYAICEQSGIDNYQYFCRRFKKEKGLTPLQYRKQMQLQEQKHQHQR